MPWCDTDAMAAHLIEISAAVDPGAQAVLIVDQAETGYGRLIKVQFMRDNWLSTALSCLPMSPVLTPTKGEGATEHRA